ARATRGLACGAEGEDEIALLQVQGEASLWKGDVEHDAPARRMFARSAPGSGPWFWALCGLSVRSAVRGDLDGLMDCVARIADTAALPGSDPRLAATLGIVSTILFAIGDEVRGMSFVRRMEEVGASLSDRDPRTRG